MAKFNISFKDHFIGQYIFESGDVTVGRDGSNSVAIDSLAIAPRHAVFSIQSDGAVIVRRLAEDAPLRVNNKDVSEQALNSGDRVSLGKHFIVVDTSTSPPKELPDAVDQIADEDQAEGKQAGIGRNQEGSLQILNGKYIGRVIPLRKSMTKLGRPEAGVAVIVRRRDGYFLSSLENGHGVKVNAVQVDESTVRLQDGDTLEIDQHRLQFYLEG